MRFEQLYYLVEVAKTKSITITSEQIYVSQSTIVSALKSLENELGVKLYTRNYHGIILSEQGEEVAKIAENILNEMNKLKKISHLNTNINEELVGQVIIYSLPTANMKILYPMVPLFSKLYPKIKLSIFEKQVSEIIYNVVNSDKAIGLIGGGDDYDLNQEIVHLSSELRYEKLLTETCYVISNKKFQLSRKKSISLSKLNSYPLAVIDNPMSLKILSRFGEPNIVFNAGNLKLFAEIIVEGLAVGIGTKQLTDAIFSNQESLTLTPFKEAFRYNTFLVHQKDALNSLETKKFISFLKSNLQKQL